MALYDEQNATSSAASPSVLTDFDALTEQMRTRLLQLESRASSQTHDLQTVANLSRQIATYLTLNDLLPQVVELTKAQFDLYHAHIYLLDETAPRLYLAAGAGAAGQRMLETGHAINLLEPSSIVAQAARDQQPVVINDVRRAETFLPNSLLPETRAEVAIPMIVGDELVGILDVQSSRANSFEETRVQVIRTLAAQIAVAVKNAQAFERVIDYEEQLARRVRQLELVAAVSLEASTRLQLDDLLESVVNLTKDRLRLYHAHIYLLDSRHDNLVLAAGAGEAGKKMVAARHTINMQHVNSLVARAAREVTAQIANDVIRNPDYLPNPYLPSTRSELALPLVIGDEVLGVLDVQADRLNYFSDEDARVFATLAGQIAVAVNNARLFTETQYRARDLEITAIVAELLRSPGDLETTLENTLIATVEALEADNGVLSLFDQEHETWNGWIGAGQGMTVEIARTFVDPKERYPHAVTVLETGQVVAVENSRTYPDFPADIADIIGIKSVLTLPVFQDETVVGVLFLNYIKQYHRFTGPELSLARSISGQLSAGIQRKQAEEEVRRRARESEIITEISSEIAANLDLESLLWNIVNLTRDRFERYHAQIYLYQPDPDRLVLRAGAGYVGRTLVERGHSIPMDREASLVARAARSREVVVINDTTSEPGFMANSLLPDTKAEIAVPIVVGTKLIGVLDIQDNRTNIFDAVIVQSKRVLANQIGVAIENAQAFAAVEAAREETARLFNASIDMLGSATFAGMFTSLNPAWSKTLGFSNDELLAEPFINFVHPDDVETTLAEAGKIADGATAIQFINRYRTKDGSYRWISWNSAPDMANNLIHFVARDVTEERAAQDQIENARYRAEVLAQVSTGLSQATDEAEILTAIGEYVAALQPTTVTLAYLENDDRGTPIASIPMAVWAGGQINMNFPNIGQPISLDYAVVSRDWLDHPMEIQQLPDVTNDPRISPQLLAILRDRGIGAVINMPLRSGGEWQGLIIITWNAPRHLSEDEANILNQVIQTASSVVSRRRAFIAQETARRQSEARARELETVAQVSAQVTGTLDAVNLLQNVPDLIKERFNLYHAHIYLMDEDTQQLVLTAGAGEAGRVMKVRGHHIPYTAETSIVAHAARTRRSQVINDVLSHQSFLPNPLLPETRAEMAIPMLVAGELVGVLDVQANHVGHFTDEDVRVKTTLANQLAIAVKNAQSFVELEQRAERERATAEQLRELDRLKSQFLANMSHELRTPLNSIIGYAEVLLDGVDGDLSDDMNEDVTAIYDSGRHLLSIINEILDLAKIEAGQMHLDRKRVELTEFVSEVVRTGQVLVKSKPVELRMVQESADPVILADPVRLRQVLWNLVSNGVKFTEQGSVTVAFGKTDDENAYVRVIDTGIGISEEHQRVIFERFSQVDGSSTRRAGGTGLGLTITQQLVQMHGGEIIVESTPGKGSTFSFTMPVYQPDPVVS